MFVQECNCKTSRAYSLSIYADQNQDLKTKASESGTTILKRMRTMKSYALYMINDNKSQGADVNINNVPVVMEYDTGAAISLITKKT